MAAALVIMPVWEEEISVMPNFQELARRVVDQAMRAGASAAEVLVNEGRDFSTVVRLGAVEKLVHTSSRRLGMRIFQGTRGAVSSSSDLSEPALERMIGDTWDMAEAAGEDPAAGIPAADSYRHALPELELFFPAAS